MTISPAQKKCCLTIARSFHRFSSIFNSFRFAFLIRPISVGCNYWDTLWSPDLHARGAVLIGLFMKFSFRNTRREDTEQLLLSTIGLFYTSTRHYYRRSDLNNPNQQQIQIIQNGSITSHVLRRSTAAIPFCLLP